MTITKGFKRRVEEAARKAGWAYSPMIIAFGVYVDGSCVKRWIRSYGMWETNLEGIQLRGREVESVADATHHIYWAAAKLLGVKEPRK